MVSNVLWRDDPARSADREPRIVALRRRPDGSVECDAARQPALEFPGCVAVPMTREELELREERLELWDARAETAWVIRDFPSPTHEQPGHAFPALAQVIAAVRGSPIKCFGTMGLLLRGRAGAPRRVMQADQSVYLRPDRAVLPGIDAMVVGEHDPPDVVLEVDHTTDVRRGKLPQYEAWGFPELWVEVPDQAARSRPRRLVPGLTIYLLGEGGYETVSESRAFPGWTAAEIHLAMNEPVLSAHTSAILERVGTAMGAAEGTGPDDDPLLRSQRRKAYNMGHAEGAARGIAAERALLMRQATRKFGADASGRLARLLARIDDPELLADAGELIIDCATWDELVARIGRIAGGGRKHDT